MKNRGTVPVVRSEKRQRMSICRADRVRAHGLCLKNCSGKLAKMSCRLWHYTKSLPSSSHKIGIWYDSIFFGIIAYGNSATPHLGNKYGVHNRQVLELRRVALRSGHPFQVSQALAVSLKIIKKERPDVLLIVSFADTQQGHSGGIYKANGWIYLGFRQDSYYIINGRTVHPRGVCAKVKAYNSRHFPFETRNSYVKKFLDPDYSTFISRPKHRYAMPLDSDVKRRLLSFSRPYPDTPNKQ